MCGILQPLHPLPHQQLRPCQGENSPRWFLNTRLGEIERLPGPFGEVKPLVMPGIQRQSVRRAT